MYTSSKNRFNFVIVFCIVFMFQLIIPLNANASDKEIEIIETKEATAVYFHTSVCLTCRESEKDIENFSEMIKTNRVQLNIISFNEAENRGHVLINLYFDAYKVPEEHRKTPILFIGDRYYSGEQAIKTGLMYELQEIKNGYIPKTPMLKLTEQSDEKIRDNFLSIKVLNVVLTGLINGLNPCALSMVLFLVSIILVKKTGILKMGFAFVSGKFIMYLLLGTIFYNLLAKLKVEIYLAVSKAILGIFVVIISIFYFMDFVRARNEQYGKIRMQLPSLLRKTNQNIIGCLQKINNPVLFVCMSFILGLVISVGEFLCTGQIFLATILYIFQSDRVLSMQAFLYLIIYTVSFIIPAVAVIFILYKTRAILEVSEAIRKKLSVIKLLSAFAFILLGVLIIFFT